jgi:MSHA biogenesis protein MshM
MYLQHFGLTHAPLGKECKTLYDSQSLGEVERQFRWLLTSPGLGLLTAEPGLGKTAVLRKMTENLNPHQYQVRYIAETDFGRLEFYRQLAQSFGLQPSYRRMDLWRNIKEYVTQLATLKNILPIVIIDEAQNLSPDFLRDFPSFLNFVFDSKSYITVWLVGHPELARTLDRYNNIALTSRVQGRCTLQPINDREEFSKLIAHGFSEAGYKGTILSDSGVELIRMTSKGNTRQAHNILVASLQLACEKKMNHLSDDIVQEGIVVLQGRK